LLLLLLLLRLRTLARGTIEQWWARIVLNGVRDLGHAAIKVRARRREGRRRHGWYWSTPWGTSERCAHRPLGRRLGCVLLLLLLLRPHGLVLLRHAHARMRHTVGLNLWATVLRLGRAVRRTTAVRHPVRVLRLVLDSERARVCHVAVG
jgi:hypothetical protein